MSIYHTRHRRPSLPGLRGSFAEELPHFLAHFTLEFQARPPGGR